MLQRACAAAAQSLTRAAQGASVGGERARLGDAAAALLRADSAVAAAFVPSLQEEMKVPGEEPGRAAKVLSFDSLELMGEDQLDEAVELVRGQQAVMDAVEQELVRLNALVSAVQGHARVQAATNPLRPQVWVAALRRALARGGVSTPVRGLWMQHLCPPFGLELATLYRRLSEHMLQQGVAAAGYKVSAPQHEGRRRAGGGQVTLRDLKRMLVSASRGEGDTQGLTRPGGHSINGVTLPAAMMALEGMNRADDVVRRMQERWRSGIWHPEPLAPQADGTHVAFTPNQTLAREVAHQMVENISCDPRLLPEIQHLVRDMEPALLHLVLHDQRFFTDRRHPARELLEEITQRSLAWTRPNTTGFAEFLGPLHEAAQALSGLQPHDAEPFHFVLQTLRQSWDETELRSRKQRASVARALLAADARNHAAAAIAATLRARPDVASAPPEVRRFLLGPWSQVIAAARIASPDGGADPGAYEASVSDIIWSSQPRLAGQNPARLQWMAAPLLAKMREALAKIGARGAEVDPFLASLSSAHLRGLRGDSGEATAASTEESAGPGQLEWHADALPWLSPEEIQDSRLLRATDFASTEPADRSLQPARSGVAKGQYIEVMVRDAWARWKLAWSSPHGSMLMFVDAAGRPESLTAGTLAQMLASGSARRVQADSVVDAALDAVAQAALESSSEQSGPV